jgi:hypothetical protein
MSFLRKYGSAAQLDGIPLVTRDAADYKANPTLASGDVKISKDGGAFANIEGAGTFGDFVTVSPAGSVSVQVKPDATAMTCKRLTIQFIDQTAPKEWEDQAIIIETYGHADAQIVGDIDGLALEASVQQAISDIAGVVMGSGATLEAIEGSVVLAKETSVQQAISDISSIASGATLQEIEGSLVLAKEATAQIISDKVDLIPLTPLLDSDIRLPETVIASQADIHGITPTDISPVLDAVSYIPTDPLRETDIRLPVGLIASQADVEAISVEGLEVNLTPVLDAIQTLDTYLRSVSPGTYRTGSIRDMIAKVMSIADPVNFDRTTMSLEAIVNEGIAGGEIEGKVDQVISMIDGIGTVGELNGAYRVNVQLYIDDTETPIADVYFDVFNADETVKLNGKPYKADSLGQASFLRDNGTYVVRPVLAGYNFEATSVTVENGDVSITIYGTGGVSENPATGDACEVYYYCFMPDAVTPMARVVAKANIENLPYSHNNKYHSGQEIDGIYSAITGKVYWHLPWGARVKFYIKYIHKDPVYGTIPEAGRAKLAEVVDR